MPLLVVLLLVPLIEIALFIKLGALIGLWPTILIIFLTAFIGMSLVRSQGVKQLAELQANLVNGGEAVQPLLHGLLILSAGIFLLTPGFFTDIVGFSLLIPAVRLLLWRVFLRKFFVSTMRFERHAHRGNSENREDEDDIVDVDFEDITEENASKWAKPVTKI